MIATDLPDVLPAAVHNATKNAVAIQSMALDWNSPEFIEADLIICCDVVWVGHLIDPLVNALSTLLTPANSGLIIHKSRSKIVDDRLFQALALQSLECRLEETTSGHSFYTVVRHIS